jgi:hypothetical protein
MIMLAGPVSKAITSADDLSPGMHRNVRDAAEIQEAARLLVIGKRHVIEVRNEGRALATKRHVRHSKIAHDRNARQHCERRGVADLQSRVTVLSGAICRIRDVVDRLSVRSDDVNCRRRQPAFSNEPRPLRRIRAPDSDVELGNVP